MTQTQLTRNDFLRHLELLNQGDPLERHEYAEVMQAYVNDGKNGPQIFYRTDRTIFEIARQRDRDAEDAYQQALCEMQL